MNYDKIGQMLERKIRDQIDDPVLRETEDMVLLKKKLARRGNQIAAIREVIEELKQIEKKEQAKEKTRLSKRGKMGATESGKVRHEKMLKHYGPMLRKTYELAIDCGMSQRMVAKELNSLGFKTTQGKEITATHVGNILKMYNEVISANENTGFKF